MQEAYRKKNKKNSFSATNIVIFILIAIVIFYYYIVLRNINTFNEPHSHNPKISKKWDTSKQSDNKMLEEEASNKKGAHFFSEKIEKNHFL